MFENPQITSVSGKNDGEEVIKNQELLTEEMLELRFITKDNAEFKRTGGGFVSLKFDGEYYERIAVHRAFPFTDPESYISVREPNGKSREIGMIKKLSDLDEDQQRMVREQIELRYFTPVIQKIREVKEEYGYSYWDVETDRGGCRFTADNNGVIKLSQTRLIISDVDGNRFELPDVSVLSAKELRMIDLYI